MKFKPLVISFGIRFKAFVFPLNVSELADGLEKKGYEISPEFPFPRPPINLSGSGEIARKGKTLIYIDTGEQLLTVIDYSIKSTLDSFDEIVNVVLEESGADINELTDFYRFNAHYVVPAQNKAYETIAKKVKVPILEDYSKILGEKIWPIEIRFGGAGLQANSEDWFEISIAPAFERNDSYYVAVNYRNRDKGKARAFVESYEEKATKLLDLIER